MYAIRSYYGIYANGSGYGVGDYPYFGANYFWNVERQAGYEYYTADGELALVITSYSIHYTKLYEKLFSPTITLIVASQAIWDILSILITVMFL